MHSGSTQSSRVTSKHHFDLFLPTKTLFHGLTYSHLASKHMGFATRWKHGPNVPTPYYLTTRGHNYLARAIRRAAHRYDQAWTTDDHLFEDIVYKYKRTPTRYEFERALSSQTCGCERWLYTQHYKNGGFLQQYYWRIKRPSTRSSRPIQQG